MKNHTRCGFTFLEAVIVLGALLLLAAFLFPIFGRARETRCGPSCSSNLKQIMLGIKQYLQDYDEKHPLIALNTPVIQAKDRSSAFGWADSLQPYLKSSQIFQCHLETTAPNSDPIHSEYTDYWFNARMAGLAERQLDAQALTIALGDGESGDARYHLRQMPQHWIGNSQSPLYRHQEGANFAFADGHAKWLRGEKWKDSLDFIPQGGPTFRLKPRF